METDRWLTTIGSVTQTVFWAIGYFFGFTLVTIFSVGTLLPGSFDEIGNELRRVGQIVYRREGKYYLIAEVVSMTGWLFLGCVNFGLFWINS